MNYVFHKLEYEKNLAIINIESTNKSIEIILTTLVILFPLIA